MLLSIGYSSVGQNYRVIQKKDGIMMQLFRCDTFQDSKEKNNTPVKRKQ